MKSKKKRKKNRFYATHKKYTSRKRFWNTHCQSMKKKNFEFNMAFATYTSTNVYAATTICTT